MRAIAAFAVVAAVLMAVGVAAAEFVREDPPRILFPRPAIHAGVVGIPSDERPPEGVEMNDRAADPATGEV